jgi:butyryl-CoA dehydrogenase
MIHEGTHGIQALDLLGRKVVMQGGRGLALLGERMTVTAGRAAQVPVLAEHAGALTAALARVKTATQSAWSTADPVEALANATPYLQAFGHVVLAWVWLDVALCAQSGLASGGDAPTMHGKLAACRYFFRYELPRIDAWLAVVATRDDTCRTMAEEWF